jgi:large subunit ribosomal protein L17
MRHRKKGRKLNRTWSHRKAMLRNMVTSFIDQGQIETTDAKAKEVRSLAERMVTLAKRGEDDLAARRQVLKVVSDKKVVAKLFTEIGPRYADRPGGYTRIVKVEARRGDGASLSTLQFVMEPVTFKEKKPRADEEYDEIRPSAKPAEDEDTAPAEAPQASDEAGGEEDGGVGAGESASEDGDSPKEG